MQADCYFTGGTSHKVCQDYARAGHLQLGQAYAAVSDGCSSSPDTDVGARLLVLAASHRLLTNSQNPISLWPGECIWNARHAMPLVLSPTCLDATLLLAVEDFDRVHVWVAGDGMIVARGHDGTRTVLDFDADGAPPYLSYGLDDPARREAWVKSYGKLTVRKNFEPEGMIFRPWQGDEPVYQTGFPANQYDLVVLLSDGVHSFRNKETQEAIPAADVVDRIMDFKTMTGEFLTRRMRAFLGRECRELGWTHYDDVGVASIYTGGEHGAAE